MASPSLRRIEAGLILAAALLSLLFHLRLPSQLPSEQDHATAAAHLAQHARAGDVLLLHPWWTERARLHSPPELPVVGHLGSEADPLTDHPRIWLLSQPELPRARREAFDARFLPGRRPLGEPRRFGTLEVALFDNGRHLPARWSATSASGLTVPVRWHDVRFAPRRCLSVRPPSGAVEVPLGELPAGEQLVLEAGLAWDSAFRGGTPVEVELWGGDQALLSLELLPRREGWFSRSLGPFEGASGARLRIRTDQPADRQLCLEVKVRGAPR